MTASLRRAGERLDAPVGAVLEGGYSLDALAQSVAATMATLAAPVPREHPGDTGVVSLAHDAARRLSQWWPSLASL